MKNRILFTFWDGGKGHLNRVLNIARMLFVNGYEIAFVTSKKYLSYLSTNFPEYQFFLVENRNHKIQPPPYPFPIYSHAFRHAQRLCGLGFKNVEFIHSIVKNEISVIEQFKPTLIINDYRDTIKISAEILRIPVMGITQTTGNMSGYTLGWWITMPEDLILPSCLDSFNEVRMHYRLPAITDERYFFEGNVNIIPSSPSIDPLIISRDCDYYVGALNTFIAKDEMLTGQTDSRSVFCYMGEGNNRPFWDFDSILFEAVMSLDLKLYVSGNADRYPKIRRLARQAKNVFFNSYWSNADFEKFFTNARIVVCHGGSIAMLSLALGKPVIFIPWNSEPISAVFVEQYGAGIHLPHSDAPLERRLAPDLGDGVEIMGYWKSSLSATDLIGALRKIINDDSFVKKAKNLSDEIRALPGPGYILQLIKEIV